MILFITRKYPPSVGGMQKQSFELTSRVQILHKSYVIPWRRSQAFLPWFLLFSMVKACWILLTKNVELIHLGDALLSPCGYLLGRIFRTPVAVTVHGRDIVFRFKPYQIVVLWSLKRLDRIICVSTSTQQTIFERGIPPRITAVIPNGIDIGSSPFRQGTDFHEPAVRALENSIGRSLSGETILLSVGRLVARKGVDYFIREMLPAIVRTKKEVMYLVVGEGSHQGSIERSIQERKLDKHVLHFKKVDEILLWSFYRIADIFVMPNIRVEGDMEGFGIVALEAGLAGLPVVASNLEGIKDAIKHGENGYLIDAGNSEEFVSAIIDLIEDPSKRENMGKKARKFVVSHFNWDDIAKRYLREFESIIKAKG
jgi:phosphatidylinositol alpha-1,6-mannosyltransferase